MPNSRVVDHLIAGASTLLRAAGAGLSMNGYQSKNREMVWKQVSASPPAANSDRMLR